MVSVRLSQPSMTKKASPEKSRELQLRPDVPGGVRLVIHRVGQSRQSGS